MRPQPLIFMALLAGGISWGAPRGNTIPGSQSKSGISPTMKTAGVTATDLSGFALQWNSPAIDAGTPVGLTEDILGNPIYGTPDIGAVEYQPPYTMGTDALDRSGKIRIYSDGKFRNLMAPVGQAAVLEVRPVNNGFSSSDRSQWMDLTVDEWSFTGTHAKKWRETAGAGLSGSIRHIVGDLGVGARYKIWVKTGAGAEVSKGVAGTNNTGKIQFDYSDGYAAEVTFRLEETSDPVTILPPGDETVPMVWGQVYAYPNPASKRVTIHAEVEGAEQVSVEIFNELGRLEKTIQMGSFKDKNGEYRVFEAVWDTGSAPSGSYVFSVEATISNQKTAYRKGKFLLAK